MQRRSLRLIGFLASVANLAPRTCVRNSVLLHLYLTIVTTAYYRIKWQQKIENHTQKMISGEVNQYKEYKKAEKGEKEGDEEEEEEDTEDDEEVLEANGGGRKRKRGRGKRKEEERKYFSA